MTRPWGPVPWMRPMSMLASFAMRRASGEANTRLAPDDGCAPVGATCVVWGFAVGALVPAPLGAGGGAAGAGWGGPLAAAGFGAGAALPASAAAALTSSPS